MKLLLLILLLDGSYIPGPAPQAGGSLFEDSAGSDITVTTNGTYYGWKTATAGSLYGGVTADVSDATADHLTIPAGGVYYTSLSMSFSGTVNSTTECAVFLSGTETHVEFRRKLNAAGDTGSAGGAGLLSITAGQELSVRCTSDGDGDVVTVERCGLTAVRVF